MRSAANDLATAGQTVRAMFDQATARVNAALAAANKRIVAPQSGVGEAPTSPTEPQP